MRKRLPRAVLFGALFLPSFLQAQKVILTDSVVLYRTIQDQSNPKTELVSIRGYVASILPRANSFEINVFKQYTGYLEFKTQASAPKNLASRLAYLPGLAQYTFDHAALKTQKEKVFRLSTGNEEAPFEYQFYPVLGSKHGGEKYGLKPLSSNETGGNYSLLLESQPQALEYSGPKNNFTVLSSPYAASAEILTVKSSFNYYSGKYWIDGNNGTQRKQVALKTEPKLKATFQSRPGALNYLKPIDKGLFTIMQVDSVLKEREVAKVQLPADFGVVAYGMVKGVPQKPVFSLSELRNKMDGFVLLTGNGYNDRKNGKSFSLVRFNSEGELLYHHDFTVEDEDYQFDQASVIANEQESLSKIILRKGLRYKSIYVKVDASGVKYKTPWSKETDKEAKLIKSSGKVSTGGSHQDTYLITLENGENMVYGADYGIGAPGGVQAGYGFTHLGADGKTKAFYNTDCRIPAQIMGKAYTFAAIYVQDGRVLLLADEPRGNSPESFKKYSWIDLEFSKTLNLLQKGEEIQLAAYRGKEEKGSSWKLFSGEPEEISREQLESASLACAPVAYIIDTRKQTISFLDLHEKGGYSLPWVNNTWIDMNSREINTFLRTRERSEDKAASYPKVVRLQALKAAY
ncbi:hypothetical protein [Leadbetterella sp. DM7]|uniref:hypothetical protein n=1 Tax=Leadbetterella sp. DM7 TaxID=3235085 RepID=UPI00349E9B25